MAMISAQGCGKMWTVPSFDTVFKEATLPLLHEEFQHP